MKFLTALSVCAVSAAVAASPGSAFATDFDAGAAHEKLIEAFNNRQ